MQFFLIVWYLSTWPCPLPVFLLCRVALCHLLSRSPASRALGSTDWYLWTSGIGVLEEEESQGAISQAILSWQKSRKLDWNWSNRKETEVLHKVLVFSQREIVKDGSQVRSSYKDRQLGHPYLQTTGSLRHHCSAGLSWGWDDFRSHV